MRRSFRNAVYNIRIINEAGAGKGVLNVSVNGKAALGNVIPIAPAGETVEVIARLAAL
jgi:hypothetical protein